MQESLYPEHEKLSAVSAISQAQGDFVEFLRERGYVLCCLDEESGNYYPTPLRIQTVLADFHEISETKLEQEKQQMLATLRVMSQHRD